MTILEVIPQGIGSRRYYLDGKRISRALFVAIKSDHYLDSFVTRTTATHTRHYCEARRIAGY